MTDYATLGAYQPTWRDQLAQWMLGDAPTPERHNFVQGLLGSSGLGSTGASVADFVPGVGQVLSAQEAAQRGDPKGFAMAMLPMPGGAVESALAKEGEEAAKRGITAYHGSPHSFDRFDISKIGAGEGAQVYGHGLYFAEHEPVAEYYKAALSNKPAFEGKPLLDQSYKLQNTTGHDYLDKIIEQSFGDMDLTRKTLEANIQAGPEPSDLPFWRKKAEERVSNSKDALKYLDEVEAGGKISPVSPGSMYQVRLNADPENFINWEKDLYHSSPSAKEALASAFPEDFKFGVSGAAPYVMEGLQRKYGADEVRRRLAEQGLPGIRYLDQGSRGAGAGTHNYVVFDDKIIDILKQYGIVPIMAGGALAGIQGNDGRAYTLTPVDRDPFVMDSPRRSVNGAPRG